MECMCSYDIEIQSQECKEVVVECAHIDADIDCLTNVEFRNAYSPYINESTLTWFQFDDKLGKFVDTGVRAYGFDADEHVISEQFIRDLFGSG